MRQPTLATLTHGTAFPCSAIYALACVCICAFTITGLAFLAFTHANTPLQPSASPYKPHACHAATCARPTLRSAYTGF